MDQAASKSPDTGRSDSNSLDHLYRLAGRHFATSTDATSAVLATISDVLGMRTSWVSHVNEASCELNIVAAHNEPGGCNVEADTQAPLFDTFCSIAMQESSTEPLVVADVRKDPTFSQSVAARSFPNIGAYIGVPIVLSDGEVYGTLCASDPEPRSITPDQARLLSILSRMLATQIERDAEIGVRESIEQRFNAFMNHSPIIAYMKDRDGRYVYTNQPFGRAFALEDGWLIGKTDNDWLDPHTAATVRENDRQILALGRSQEFIEEAPTALGKIRYFIPSSSRLLMRMGKSLLAAYRQTLPNDASRKSNVPTWRRSCGIRPTRSMPGPWMGP